MCVDVTVAFFKGAAAAGFGFNGDLRNMGATVCSDFVMALGRLCLCSTSAVPAGSDDRHRRNATIMDRAFITMKSIISEDTSSFRMRQLLSIYRTTNAGAWDG